VFASSLPVKRFVQFILIAVLTVAIVLYQPLPVFGYHDFAMTPDGYKVFSYGFPFRIVDRAEHLSMHMPFFQVSLRLLGNFGVFFFCGAIIVQIVRVRAPQKQQDPE